MSTFISNYYWNHFVLTESCSQ